MATKTIIKLVIFALIIAVGLVAIIFGKIASMKKDKKNGQDGFRRMIRFRLICFIIMLVLVLIALFI